MFFFSSLNKNENTKYYVNVYKNEGVKEAVKKNEIWLYVNLTKKRFSFESIRDLNKHPIK